jgi:HEPN domain-containing protein
MENFKAAKKWIDKALNDMRAADIILSAESFVPYDVVCFHCQQAVEKFLKSYLVFNNIDFPFTHNLITLSELIFKSNSDSNIKKVFACLDVLEPYSVASRYPDDIGVLQREDAVETRSALRDVYEWLSNELPELFE